MNLLSLKIGLVQTGDPVLYGPIFLTSTFLILIPTPIYLPGPLGRLGCDHHQTAISFWVFFLVPSTQYFGAGNNNDNSKHMSSWSFDVYNSSILDKIRV